jgi:hypothetical protein
MAEEIVWRLSAFSVHVRSPSSAGDSAGTREAREKQLAPPRCTHVHIPRQRPAPPLHSSHAEAHMPKRTTAAKRELIDTGTDKRFVRRKRDGTFKESDDVGRSLAQDQQREATHISKKGQGDRGDRERLQVRLRRRLRPGPPSDVPS